MKIKSLVLLFVGLFLLTIIAGCDMEYLEDMVNEIYQDEETLDKDGNTSAGNVSENANPPVGDQSPEEDKPTSNPETPEEIPPVETPPSQVPGEEQPSKPPVSPEQPAPTPQPPEAKPDVPVAPEWTMPQTTVSGTTVIKNITASAADLATTKISAQVNDDSYIYIAIKIQGTSATGRFKQRHSFGSGTEGYPRRVEFQLHDKADIIPGTDLERLGYDAMELGYTNQYGFSNSSGSDLNVNMYYSPASFRILKSGSGVFTFTNFVITDNTLPTLLGGSLAFCRLNSKNPLTIKIPTNEYNPNIHKNVARVTVFFEPDRNTTGNFYTVIFDGFEPKDN